MITTKSCNEAECKKFDSINNRLMEFLGVDELQKVADKIGMKKQAFYARRQTDSFPYEQTIKALQGSGVSFEWLFYGLGEMRIIPRLKLGNDPEAPMGKIAVKIFPSVSASAGYGCLNGDHCEFETLFIDRNLLPRAASKNIDAITANGDSMSPKISDGDMIFVDKNQREIRNGKIFIIRMNEEIFVKKIFVAPKGLIVKSDNDDYPSFEVSPEDIEVLGQVLYRMEYIG